MSPVPAGAPHLQLRDTPKTQTFALLREPTTLIVLLPFPHSGILNPSIILGVVGQAEQGHRVSGPVRGKVLRTTTEGRKLPSVSGGNGKRFLREC